MENTDKIVVAILAAAKAAADKKELPGQYVAEYQRMLRVFERRSTIADADDTKTSAKPASTLPAR